MMRYLELAEYICLVVSVSNFIALVSALREKKNIYRIIYFINNLGITVLSNLIIWMEGWYADENNLSGSTVSFFLNICIVVLFILNNIIVVRCNKAEPGPSFPDRR